MAEKIVQTAGRNQLGEFAPMFAHLNDDVLFGEVWNEEAIDVNGFLPDLSSAEREGAWRDQGRDRSHHHPRDYVCRLAQRMGGVQTG